jgi:hypothetical protein
MEDGRFRGEPPAVCKVIQVVANRGGEMRASTAKEKVKITAGAVASLVIVGWLVVLAIAFLSAR